MGATTTFIRYNRKYWNLLWELLSSQFKVKDQSTVLGYFWSFLHPLIMLGVLFLVFHNAMGRNIPHYAMYLLIGLVHYAHFSNSTSASLHALLSMRNLTTDTIFPKELLVIGTALATSIDFVVSVGICLLIAFLSGLQPGWGLLMLPAIIVLQVTLVLWVALFLSCLFVFVRDIDHLYQLFLRLLFFVTPIFYAPSFLMEGKGKYVVLLNPLTHLITFARTILIEGSSIPGRLFLALLFVNLCLLCVGFVVFRKYEPAFAERI